MGRKVYRAQIASLARQGFKPNEIAKKLGCSPRTAREHSKGIAEVGEYHMTFTDIASSLGISRTSAVDAYRDALDKLLKACDDINLKKEVLELYDEEAKQRWYH